MKLKRWIDGSNRRLVVPLMGYPGSRLTGTTLKQNEFNWGIQFWSLSELVDVLAPDAMFFMMDLSVEAGALGFPIRYPLEESPTVEEHLVRVEQDLEKFMSVDILKDARVAVYLKTLELMEESFDISKGAYCIGPFTLAGLLLGASDVALRVMDEPAVLHRVLDFCTHVIERYAVALVDAGADLVAVLEPTAVMLSPAQFEAFSGAYIRRLGKAVHAPLILHVCGNTTHLVEAMCRTGAQGLSLDSMVDFPAIAPRMDAHVALIGNLDPVRVLRNLTPEGVRERTREFLEATRDIPNLIVSTGCDLPQDTPIENIRAMIETVKDWPLPEGLKARPRKKPVAG